MEIFKLPQMIDDEIQELVKEQIVCRMAFKGGRYPSVSMFQYTNLGGSLFFHFTEYGNKLESMKRDDHVSVEIEDLAEDLREFRFVLLRGRLRDVKDQRLKDEVIEKMAREGEKRLSPKFLAAHGFGAGSDWSTFRRRKTMAIVEFLPSEASGLKLP